LDPVQRHAQALLRRTNDLLDLGRLESGSLHADCTRIDFASIVRLVCSCFASAARGLRLDVDTPPELLAELDAQKAERIVFHLLSNAFRFTPAPGRVEVALALEPGFARLTVQDTGPGVPAHLREAAFDLPTEARERKTPRRDGDAGIGLAIVRGFVQLHGGTVTLDDAPAGGARFTVRLPLRAAGARGQGGARRASALEETPSPLPSPASGRGRGSMPVGKRPARAAAGSTSASGVRTAHPEPARVLVVEDHPETNAFIVEALARRYRVITALDGQDGLEEALRDPPPDLVVLDLVVPMRSGEALIERLRHEPRLADVPVLVLTEQADNALQARVLREGAHGFLQKPFSGEVLLEAAARLLEGRRSHWERLQRSEMRLRGILETARDAIIVTDSADRIVLFNRGAQRIFGYTAHAVLGESIHLLIPAECWTHCHGRGATNTTQPNGEMPNEPVSCDLGEARRADGEVFPVECSMSQLDGEGTFHTIILRDITRRVRDHGALEQAHEELQRVTQAFQQELIAAVEASQAELARDLHDSVGASLAGISLVLGGVRSIVIEPRVGAAIERAQEQIASTADAVRRISRGLMPAGTDGAGLVQALEQFATDLQDSGVRCELLARGGFGALDASTATHVFRVVQEAASNAIRHGDATALRIVLASARGRWRVTVVDNGTGCELDRLPGLHPGLGVRSMQARARAIHGRLELGMRAQGGCRVRLAWGTPAATAKPVVVQARAVRHAKPQPVA
jgi:PAS domain S-box-containing protein